MRSGVIHSADGTVKDGTAAEQAEAPAYRPPAREGQAAASLAGSELFRRMRERADACEVFEVERGLDRFVASRLH
jgi:hypothetical protein